MKTPPPTTESQTAARIEYLLALPVMTTNEASEVTGLSVPTIKRAIADGRLPCIRVGARVVLPTAHVLAFVGVKDGAAT